MRVLKFGGSSVASAENILKVTNIIKSKVSGEPMIVVVSALGGITDLLLDCAVQAAKGNESYKVNLQQIEKRHLDAVKQLLPVTGQSGILSKVKKLCNDTEDICNGIFLLSELTDRTRDNIMSHGELLSSQIIAATLVSLGLDAAWKDSRELIITDSNYGSALVDFGPINIP